MAAGAWCARIWPWLQDSVGVDRRSLALLRVTTGLCVMFDIYQRWQIAFPMYADGGLAPRSLEVENADFSFSLYLAGGSEGFVKSLFLLTTVCAAAQIVGFFTNVASIMVLVLTISLHTRNGNVNNGGDCYLRVILIWGCLTPWGEEYSLDQILSNTRTRFDRDRRVVSLACTGLALQTVFVYIQTAYLKQGPEWRSSFDAVWLSLMVDVWGLPLGRFLRQFPLLMKGLTVATMFIETVGACLLVTPFGQYTGIVRAGVVFSFIGFQLGLLFCIRLSLFPYAMNSGMVSYIPPFIWDRFCGNVRGTRGWARTMQALEWVISFTDRPLSAARIDALFTPNARAHDTDAAAAADTEDYAEAMPGLSVHQVSLTKRGSSRSPARWTATDAEDTKDHPRRPTRRRFTLGGVLREAVAAGLLGYMIQENMYGLDFASFPKLVRFEKVDDIGYMIGFRQNRTWNMFDFNLEFYDQWWSFEGVLGNKREDHLNLMTDAKLGSTCRSTFPVLDKPPDFGCLAWYGQSDRWFDFLMRATSELQDNDDEVHLSKMSAYLCLTYNAELEYPSDAHKMLQSFTVRIHYEESIVDGYKEKLIEPSELWTWDCFDAASEDTAEPAEPIQAATEDASTQDAAAGKGGQAETQEGGENEGGDAGAR